MSNDEILSDEQILEMEKELHRRNTERAQEFEQILADTAHLHQAKGPAPQWVIDRSDAYNQKQAEDFELAQTIAKAKEAKDSTA